MFHKDVWDKSYCLFWDPHKTHKCNVITVQNFWMLNLVVRKVSGRLLKVNIRCTPKSSVLHGSRVYIWLLHKLSCSLFVRTVCIRCLFFHPWHLLEGCLTVHLPHEIMWNASLMQQRCRLHRTRELRSGSQDHPPFIHKLGAENHMLQLNI